MRLIFRQIEREDLPLLRDWRNQERIRKACREYRLLNMVNQEVWFNRISTSKIDDMFLIVFEDKPVGACGLTHIDWKNRHAELSYFLGEELSSLTMGKIALEVYDFLKRKAFKEYNLNRIWGEIYSFNEIALKLALKNGLTQEGILKEAYFWDGTYWDSIIVGMTRSKYE